MRVAVFTDNDFDKVNGVTTTLRAMLQHAPPGVQPRIYTASDLAIDAPEYFALKSIGVGIPFYREMRMYAPRLRMFARQAVADGVSVVHVTTPGPIGLAGRYVAARLGLPLVGSFHTHLAEYATMLSGSSTLGRVTRAYMNWLYRPSRQLLVPSESTRTMLASGGFDRSRLHLWTRGVDTRTFAPSRRSATLRERWGVSDRRPALLYVGRLSREKGLALFDDLQTALIRYHVSHRFVFVGDGPMRTPWRPPMSSFFRARPTRPATSYSKRRRAGCPSSSPTKEARARTCCPAGRASYARPMTRWASAGESRIWCAIRR
jgi:glycosyltransferase involved in cell wall biosynthesis